MRKELDVQLAWPNKDLSPNARVHFFAKSKLVRVAKGAALLHTKKAMKAAGITRAVPVGKVNVQIVPVPPTRRSQDEDNLLAKMKSALDGIAEGIGVDDRNFHFLEQVWFPAKKPGKIFVRLSWEEDDE